MTVSARQHVRLPARPPTRLPAGAWWMWAAGLVVAATATTNPLFLGAILVVSGLVVAARRPTAGWAGGYRLYLVLALVVVAIRVIFRVVLGTGFGVEVIFTLPRIDIPAGGLQLGGPVTLESLVAGLYDGLRLATIIACIGAANTLADPRRLVGSLPKALGGVATSIVVALSIAPHLVESLQRVGRARRLRGEDSRGWSSVRSLLVPVLEDSLQRSLSLAASMEGRGYGRRTSDDRGRHWLPLLSWAAIVALATGMFGLLSLRPSPAWSILIAAGLVLTAAVIAINGRGTVRTRYRPDRWGLSAWLVATSSVVAAAAVVAADPATAHPSIIPLAWPAADPFVLTAVAVAVLPAVAAPPVTGPVRLPERAPA